MLETKELKEIAQVLVSLAAQDSAMDKEELYCKAIDETCRGYEVGSCDVYERLIRISLSILKNVIEED